MIVEMDVNKMSDYLLFFGLKAYLSDTKIKNQVPQFELNDEIITKYLGQKKFRIEYIKTKKYEYVGIFKGKNKQPIEAMECEKFIVSELLPAKELKKIVRGVIDEDFMVDGPLDK